MKEKERKILEDFGRRQCDAYLEMLMALPEEQRPKTDADLKADFLEFLVTVPEEEK